MQNGCLEIWEKKVHKNWKKKMWQDSQNNGGCPIVEHYQQPFFKTFDTTEIYLNVWSIKIRTTYNLSLWLYDNFWMTLLYGHLVYFILKVLAWEICNIKWRLFLWIRHYVCKPNILKIWWCRDSCIHPNASLKKICNRRGTFFADIKLVFHTVLFPNADLKLIHNLIFS